MRRKLYKHLQAPLILIMLGVRYAYLGPQMTQDKVADLALLQRLWSGD